MPLNYYRIIFGNANVSRIVSIVSRNDNILVGKFYSEALSGFTIPRFAPRLESQAQQGLPIYVNSCPFVADVDLYCRRVGDPEDVHGVSH